MAIIEELGRPILSASLPGDIVEDYTDPEIMQENFWNDVDYVIDGGIGGMIPSTIVDCTGDEPVVIRRVGRMERIDIVYIIQLFF